LAILLHAIKFLLLLSSTSPIQQSEENMRAGILALVAPAVLLASAHATELTAANWDESVGGKTVFIKFLAPW